MYRLAFCKLPYKEKIESFFVFLLLLLLFFFKINAVSIRQTLLSTPFPGAQINCKV